MADDPGNEDSYSYPQENMNTEYGRSSTEGSTEGYKTILRNRRMWLIVGGIAAVWVVSYILGMLWKEEEKSSTQKSLEAVKVATVQQENKQEAVKTRAEEGDAKLIASVEDSLKTNSGRIAEISKDKEMLQSQITELTNSMHDMSYKIDLLMTKVSDVTDKVKEMTKPKPIPKTLVIEKPKKIFNLRAIIIGRAWLVDSDGQTLTVSLGDNLEDYGKIKAIYPDEGFITTTSGRIIQFGQNDK